MHCKRAGVVTIIIESSGHFIVLVVGDPEFGWSSVVFAGAVHVSASAAQLGVRGVQ